MITVEFTQEEVDELVACLRSMNECDEDIFKYPTGFSDAQLNEIRAEHKVRVSALEKMLKGTSFQDAMSNVQ